MAEESTSPQLAAASPKANPSKAVTISEEPDTILPQLTRVESPSSIRHHRVSMSGKRLTGRPPPNASSASLHSISSQISQLNLDAEQDDQSKPEHHEPLLSQVVGWLQDQKTKQMAKVAHAHQRHQSNKGQSPRLRPRSDSHSSDTALALDKLERILTEYTASGKETLAALGLGHAKPSTSKRSSISRMMKRASVAVSSDTEYQDGDILVPNVEAILDNSKTMSYSGGQADTGDASSMGSERRAQEKRHWTSFKQDIVRLTHTLRLKGWRRIPIEKAGEISVERLSGALTNAVYVVAPPNIMPSSESSKDGSSAPAPSKRPPMKLLLRVYGPNVEHLIDRESELAILRRLSRKRIGPRLLGTFTNGRFEEFFHAKTLTPDDLRDPNISRHIAKRMRELHEGIELLPEEREGGPSVFKNWDAWVDRCEQIITWIDKQTMSSEPTASLNQKRLRESGFLLGTQWYFFRQIVERSREHLHKVYGGKDGIKKKLVFAHNDTQYGNLLRLQPSGESPLLLPANSHKQLVVIDFEYASANTPAQEFANHFTEWCYNYHHSTRPYRCTTELYPSPQEQHRFIRSYVEHRPQFNLAAQPSATPSLDPSRTPSVGPSMTPNLTPQANSALNTPPIGPTSSISAFMLDSRAPPGGFPFPSNYEAEERAREEATEREVQGLMHETRLWRMMNSAMWVAWGLVQAKMPDEFEQDVQEKTGENQPIAMTDPLDPEVKQLAEDAKNDRPEGRKQEKEHHEGDAHRPNTANKIDNDERTRSAPSISVTTPTQVEHATTDASVHTTDPNNETQHSEENSAATSGEDESSEAEFDYLAYAQERALFFWGDVISLGIVKKEELPTELLGRVKLVEY